MAPCSQEHNLLAGKLISFSKYIHKAILSILQDPFLDLPLANLAASEKVYVLSNIGHHLSRIGDTLGRKHSCVDDAIDSLEGNLKSYMTNEAFSVPYHLLPTKCGLLICKEYIDKYPSGLPVVGSYEWAMGELIRGIGEAFTAIRYNTVYNGRMLEDPGSTARALTPCFALSEVLNLGVVFEQGNPQVVAYQVAKVIKQNKQFYPVYKETAKNPYLNFLERGLAGILDSLSSSNNPAGNLDKVRVD